MVGRATFHRFSFFSPNPRVAILGSLGWPAAAPAGAVPGSLQLHGPIIR